MDIPLGKRKRREQIEDNDINSRNHEHIDYLQTILQQHFETKFEPLLLGNEHSKASPPASESETNDDEYGWSGFSEEEEGTDAKIVDHQAMNATSMQLSKSERKYFMVRTIVVMHRFPNANLYH